MPSKKMVISFKEEDLDVYNYIKSFRFPSRKIIELLNEDMARIPPKQEDSFYNKPDWKQEVEKLVEEKFNELLQNIDFENSFKKGKDNLNLNVGEKIGEAALNSLDQFEEDF